MFTSGFRALREKHHTLAIGFWSEYVRQDPGNFSAYWNLGKAHWQSGERLQALSAFRRVLELSAGHEEALRFLQGGVR